MKINAYIIFFTLTLFSSMARAILPSVPFPENVVVQVVGEDFMVNGLPIMAYEFHANKKKNGF